MEQIVTPIGPMTAAICTAQGRTLVRLTYKGVNHFLAVPDGLAANQAVDYAANRLMSVLTPRWTPSQK